MAELSVIGSNEFIMGFKLIGIKKIFEANTSEELKKKIDDARVDKKIGIIVLEEKSIIKLDQNYRKEIENSKHPVVVILSDKEVAQSNLRDMIKKAIGVDIW